MKYIITSLFLSLLLAIIYFIFSLYEMKRYIEEKDQFHNNQVEILQEELQNTDKKAVHEIEKYKKMLNEIGK